jgi:PPK2 family polyphosphate:nucleotide phosphotransferase
MRNIRITDLPSKPPEDVDKGDIKDQTADLVERLGELQKRLRAQEKHSVLVIFQGMDASGKDGAVRKVFKHCHPEGMKVHSFKKPTDEEFAHDFLWRIHKHAPAKGRIQIFNRSHYEDVLIQRVHGWISEKIVDLRFDAINAFEQLLSFDNNTVILKFFLNISYEQQAIELQERIDEHDKHWKHNAGDWKEREHWDEYMRCYENVLNRSTIPWTNVPVDERWYRDYVVAKTIVEALEQLDLAFPPLKKV